MEWIADDMRLSLDASRRLLIYDRAAVFPENLVAAWVFGRLRKRMGSMALASSLMPMPIAANVASTLPRVPL